MAKKENKILLLVLAQLIEEASLRKRPPTIKEQLATAILLASSGHYGQFDKGDNPYILHPLRIMIQFDDDEQKIIGILHDLIEDTVVTLDDLKKLGFSTRVILAADDLTHREGESYFKYVMRIVSNMDSREAKKKDLKDNSDITRLKNARLKPKDVIRMEKYANTYQFLSGKLSITDYEDIMNHLEIRLEEVKRNENK